MGRILITGVGTVSPIGRNTGEAHIALRSGRSGIGKARHFQSRYTDLLSFGEVDLSDTELRIMTKSENELQFTRTTLLALCAFSEAIDDAQLNATQLTSADTAFISSSTVGGMCYTDELYRDANRKSEPSRYIRSYEGSDHTLRIIQRFGLAGYSDTINTACSSSANAILLGARLIRSGRAKRAIVGGADSLAKYTVNGFNALQILSPVPCRPFHEERDGLTLGEGAAYLVLESEECATGKEVYAEVSGCGNANDAFHPSTTSDDARGPVLAMTEALREAALDSSDIGYVNAHGTGTQNNDFTESVGFLKVFGTVPPFNSTKSYTGHTLAAAGALEAVFSLLSMRNGELYPSLRCERPIDSFDFKPIGRFMSEVEIAHVMSNSFGFGGNCTSLIFSHVHS